MRMGRTVGVTVAVLTIGLGVSRSHGLNVSAPQTGRLERPTPEKVQAWLLQNRWDLICPALQASPPTPAMASAVVASAWTDCLDRAGRPAEAWSFVKDWLERRDRSEPTEDLWVRYVHLTAYLYQTTGQGRYWEVYQAFLRASDRFVRYYAAFQLSYWSDPARRRSALPVLREILTRETDPNLLARAQLAWLRIEPHSVPEVRAEKFRNLRRHVLVQMYDADDKATIRLRLPLQWAVWWFQQDTSLPIEAETRNRLIRLLSEPNSLSDSQVLLEVRDPKRWLSIEIVTPRP
ncbi:MAG: hypothetical protein NZ742_01855 [Acidobacteria bacterium]|nr:hypothetical protein [Acidobacteriota bacterium]MDW7983083.1 hypothetical protein [Acidobacteriota bacterium]